LEIIRRDMACRREYRHRFEWLTGVLMGIHFRSDGGSQIAMFGISKFDDRVVPSARAARVAFLTTPRGSGRQRQG
jgi:hypothetical protein